DRHEPFCGEVSREFQAVLDDFTKLWEEEEIARAEDYFARIGPVAPRLAVEVIYREFCLAEGSGLEPDPKLFLARFPEYRQRLERLFAVHRHFSASQLRRWVEPEPDADNFPQPGDDIGPYVLFRELGRGGFARVYLAGQADLENRLVVVKLSTRSTREPWLLARVRHAHIVEILSHAVVDDGAFQLICMPFMGGATLSAVLHQRRQVPSARPLPGELLRVLDRVSAPEYSGTSSKRPAREILATLPDAQAFAWITARLAEALDHAFCRGVAHGDVKPSNILITADGNPMLLDFNLAQDWSLIADGRSLEEFGGTLAYMAPERLRAIASGRACLPEPLDAAVGPGESAAEDRFEPHRADIYSLGVVLLEAIAGAAPLSAEGDETGPTWAGKGLYDLAALHASFRGQGASAVIAAAESRRGKPVPPALRAILERCLAPNSKHRYRRALELAEDLDRWRTDRPLAYASEPFWTQTVPRWLRTRRRLLWTVGLVVAASMLTMRLVLFQTRTTLQNLALLKLARNWDDIESSTFQYQRPGQLRLQDPDSSDILATAVRALKEYGVLDSEGWRQCDDVRNLPVRDREDLELWLMEQVYRYARALGDRPGSRGDWARAIAALDRLATTPPLQAAEALRRRVLGRLTGVDARDARADAASSISKPAARVSENTSPRPAPLPGLDEYLQGIAAELEDTSEPSVEPQSDASLPVLQTAQRALEHYDQVLARNPGSFWGHYRAAV
ncbi:MAG: serine/threonine protein kinase, partial [Planctomycetaceae bacterium]|nr:serine/threonine protein kinase [Planctomycetaceae bacterium]